MAMLNAFGNIFAGKRVLVTGHTGFKGSWLCMLLNMVGARVIGFSLDPKVEGKHRNFHYCRLGRRISAHLTGDIRRPNAIRSAIKRHRPDIIIHMAAQSLVKPGYEDPKKTFDTNIGGTVNLLEAVRKANFVKALVAVTTDKVYENRGLHRGYNEKDTLGGYDPYSTSKAMMELCVRSYRRSWKERWEDKGSISAFSKNPVSIATARAGNVIGGGDFSRYRLVPDCARALLSKTPMTINNPDSIRPWQFVLEPLCGYLWLAANMMQDDTGKFSDAWNFGPNTKDALKCKDIVKQTLIFWGSGESRCLEPDIAKRHESRLLKLDWTKALKILKWKPAYNWKEGLKATIEWYKQYAKQGGRSGSAPGSVDMHGFCENQIKQYIKKAAKKRIPWAKPG